MIDLIEACTIFAKYTDSRNPCGCEHDVLRVYVSPQQVSEADKRRLDELGFHQDPESLEFDDCFYSFRFGSA